MCLVESFVSRSRGKIVMELLVVLWWWCGDGAIDADGGSGRAMVEMMVLGLRMVVVVMVTAAEKKRQSVLPT